MFDEGGWDYRRRVIEHRRRIEQWNEEQRQLLEVAEASYLGPAQEPSAQFGGGVNQDEREFEVQFAPLPDSVPDLNEVHAADKPPTDSSKDTIVSIKNPSASQSTEPQVHHISPFDPGAAHRKPIDEETLFDPMKDQHTGIILGIGISSIKSQTADGTIKDIFMVRPGDDVQIMFPTVGANARPVHENCTVVDFYSSNMHCLLYTSDAADE